MNRSFHDQSQVREKEIEMTRSELFNPFQLYREISTQRSMDYRELAQLE